MTKTIKRFLPLAIIIILLSAVFLAGCEKEGSTNGEKLVLVSSPQQLIFNEDETPDLNKIVFTVVDVDGNIAETVVANQSMLSASDLNKLRTAGIYTVVINYNSKRLNVQVAVNRAVHKITEYKVFFDCNEVYGANNTPNRGHFAESEFSIMQAPDGYIDGSKLIVLPIPFLTGFVFKGWYPDRNGTGTKLNIQAQSPYNLTAETTTFFAQWEDQRKFSVRFVNQITNIEIESQTIEYGKPAIIPSLYTLGLLYDFNTVRYVFDGWQVDGDGSYADVTQNLTVYATFSVYKINVIFYKADQLTIHQSFLVNYGGTFSRDDVPPIFFEGEYTQGYSADWIDSFNKDPLPDTDMTNLRADKKIYIKYTEKPMKVTFYHIPKAEYDALGGDVPESQKQVVEVQYNRALATVQPPPLHADDPDTPEVNESLKYNADWRIYNGDIPSVPNFAAAVKADTYYFVLYTVKTFTITFTGYNDINGIPTEDIRVSEYGDKISAIILPDRDEYDPLVANCTWHTNEMRDDDKLFKFSDIRITQSYTLYLKTTNKPISVYYCMPEYYSLSGQSNYDKLIELTINSNLKTVSIENGAYSFGYQVDIADQRSSPQDGVYHTAYALAHQAVSSSSADQRPSYNFQKYRQATYNNGTSKWYDYNQTVWNFSTDFYQSLRNYVLANKVPYVVLYAAVFTNELQITYKNISYAGGAANPQFYDLAYGSAFPHIVAYGETFDPAAYIASLAPFDLNDHKPNIEGEDINFAFGGWYTTPGYRPGTRVSDGESIKIVDDTVFYAKWVDDEVGSEGLVFTQINDDEWAVSGYIYPQDGEDVLRIPFSYEGKPVTTIRAGALDVPGVAAIKELELRSSLLTIQDGALTSLTGLTAITIHNNNSDYFVLEGGVLYTHNMSKLIKCPTAATIGTLVIPAEVTHIAKEAFALCAKLTEIQFETNSLLDTIGENAFWECENLLTVSLPKSLKHIEERAFYEAARLANITLEAGQQYNILTCGFDAFSGTRWLSNSTGQVILGNVLVIYKDGELPEDKLVIDNIVSTVADGAFSQQALTFDLVKITFTAGSNLERIGNLAFNACPLLATIEILCDRLVDFQTDAFSGISSDSVLYVAPSKLNTYKETYTNIHTSEIYIDVSDIQAAGQ